MTIRRSHFLAAILILALTPTTGGAKRVRNNFRNRYRQYRRRNGDATVTLTNLDTNRKRKSTTDASGTYTFVNIVPGRYRIEARKAALRSLFANRSLWRSKAALKVDIALQVGAHRKRRGNRRGAFAPAGNELAGASRRTTNGHRAAPERPQPACPDATRARRRAAGPALGWELLHGQPGRRESVCSGRFSDRRRHGRSEPDSD